MAQQHDSTLHPRIDLRAETSTLAGFDGRAAGSDSERRAAAHLRDRLRALGRDAEIEPTTIRPRWALAQALAAALVVVGSVISVSSVGLGTVLAAVGAASSILEAMGVLSLIRRLTGTRASQNVSSPGGTEKRGVLLLVTHVDAPRESSFRRVAGRVGDPWLLTGGSALLVLSCCVLRLLGFEGNGLTAIQLVPTLLLLGAVPLLVDHELSPPGRGGADAAAAAAVLSVAGELRDQLRYLDLWVVVSGARASFGAGMRAWLRRHRRELDPRRTVVVAVEALGSGGVRYSRRAGPTLLSWRTNRDLVRLCDEIATDDDEGTAFGAAASVSRESGDAVAALSRGLPTIEITTVDRERVDAEAVARARDFCAELARRIDGELAPRLHEEPLRQE